MNDHEHSCHGQTRLGHQRVSYFNGGDALHEFPRYSYGFPQSLGCVEMPFASAETVLPYTPIGTLVTVIS